MRLLGMLGFTATVHEGGTLFGFTSEQFVIITNFLVVFASLVLAFVTYRDAVKDREDERRNFTRMFRILVRQDNTPRKHKKEG